MHNLTTLRGQKCVESATVLRDKPLRADVHNGWFESVCPEDPVGTMTGFESPISDEPGGGMAGFDSPRSRRYRRTVSRSTPSSHASRPLFGRQHGDGFWQAHVELVHRAPVRSSPHGSQSHSHRGWFSSAHHWLVLTAR